jgi:uncharacterized membrane protein YkgB
MEKYYNLYDSADEKITTFMKNYGILFLRISVGIVFFWFGVLKFFPNLSPAQGLALDTIEKLTFGFINANVAILILAAWEVLIGLGLLFGFFLRTTLFLLFAQMLGAMAPLFLFPSETFTRLPYVPTLEGQYIIKNLVLISAGLVVGATVRSRQIERKKTIN